MAHFIEPATYFIHTLGCDKNTVDSDQMGRLLGAYGLREALRPERAQIVIVNTCGFIDAATEQSLGTLRAYGAAKTDGQALIAAGCLAGRANEMIMAEAPQVDAVIGALRWREFGPTLHELDKKIGLDLPILNDGEGERIARDAEMGLMRRAKPKGPSAFLKISDGCDAACSFCIIPQMKGKNASRPADAIVREARALVHGGARELVIVGQDTTFFGRDLGVRDGTGLAQLLPAIAGATAPDLLWLRLMYAYPRFVSEPLIEAMAALPQMAHYIDMPLQHAAKSTLRRMRRPSDQTETYGVIARLRAAMPDIAIRTTFIVGFPGETQGEFDELCDFVREMRFDNVGVFKFSPQATSPSASMDDQIVEEVKQERYDTLMAIQQDISAAKQQALVGTMMTVLIEGEGQVEYEDEPGTQQVKSKARRGKSRKQRAGPLFAAKPAAERIAVGRTYRHAPEVDGYVLVQNAEQLKTGSIAQVEITHATEYDLWGKAITWS